jgi:hypothetical protein
MSIVGGFVQIPVTQILAVWFACQGLTLGVGEFRAWLACHEMVARRSRTGDGRRPSYGYAELAKHLDVTASRARRLVAALVSSNLLEWSEAAITFPDLPPCPDDLLESFAHTIGGGQGSLMVPRRILRLLAGGARRARIAVVLAALFRCLSRRRDGFRGWGRFKASWVALAFRVGLREVKSARMELVALGWLSIQEDDRQGPMNRQGRAYLIALAWMPPATSTARSAPLPSPNVARTAPPLDPIPLREGDQNQDPAPGGPAGVRFPEIGEEIRTPPTPEPLTMPIPPIENIPTSKSGAVPTPRAVTPVVSGPAPKTRASASPRLSDVKVEDLKDTSRTLALLNEAVGQGWMGPSEADRLRFVGAAEHALAVGEANPAGLFVHLVRGKWWRFVTCAEEDRANARLKVFLRGPEPPPIASFKSGRPVRPELSEDARTVIWVRSASAAAGYRGDPFPQVRRHDQSWTRERWDLALAELGGL